MGSDIPNLGPTPDETVDPRASESRARHAPARARAASAAADQAERQLRQEPIVERLEAAPTSPYPEKVQGPVILRAPTHGPLRFASRLRR